ncbi:MAG: hypothetical protein OMM_00455 [Candidatus Magnetoglobus multicellularis str. Araruama]|uniref:N-acetyltransferase domain-containing protein n=1 Tax=Candidatus Magnetoglobus multicellularis str. Araruama TaxID=890399 RepID=A0A1V1PH34_9BACT|nr:MAG: hypothetical protein OMM_00455 [Candidatus Magnetoglobus multicellularis str. Araruama]
MPHNKRLDILLQAMAYKKVLPTRWMTMDIEKMQSGNANHPGHCMIKQSDDWPLNRKRIAGYSENEARIYGAFFKAIHLQTYPLVLEVNQTPVTCGLGVQTGKHLGIFDIRTKASFQRQGYAKILVQSILKYAYQNGAMHAQLHVDSNNHAAINLYQKLGFQPICDYWFRRA